MVKKIVNVKDPRLRQKSKPVRKIDKKILKLIQDLKDTIKVQKDPEGVGLAAPQIGKNVRIFLVRYGDDKQIFINPKIISLGPSKKKEKKVAKGKKKKSKPKIMEGCLSLPHYYGPITRSQKLKLSYTTEKGKQVTKTFEGFMAQIIQHEIDHLNGVLFVDKLLEQKKPLYELVGDEWEKVEI